MAGRRFILFVVLTALFSCCAALADDSNGNISVHVTKLDESYQFLIYIVVGVVVAVALALSTILLLRSRQPAVPARFRDKEPVRRPVQDIRLKAAHGRGFRHDGYYTEVFSRPKQELHITDEKERPAVLVGTGTSDVDRYLKEDERIVLNVLRMKHNSCSQATVRVVTDFSKARLSRILSELEARGIIYKEQSGRKNIITLRE